MQGFHQECKLQDIFTFNVFHLISSKMFTSHAFGQLMNFFIEVAEAKKEEEAKKKLTELRDSPRTVDMFMKTFSYKDSKFQTICHADFWTSQIMFSLNEDGEQIRPPKYFATPGLNILLFQEVQNVSRSSTTRCQCLGHLSDHTEHNCKTQPPASIG